MMQKFELYNLDFQQSSIYKEKQIHRKITHSS